MEVDFITSKLLDREKFSIVSDDFPIGSIVAYAGDLTNLIILKQLYMAGWLLCDGKSYDKNEKGALYEVIGTTNGGNGNRFNVPDLRDRFLKGKPGRTNNFYKERNNGNELSEKKLLKSSKNGVPVKGIASSSSTIKYKDILTSIIDNACLGRSMGKSNISEDAEAFSTILAGSETSKTPVNIALYYIIKASNRQTSGTTPSGAIIAYGGGSTAGLPGWLKCDGSFYYNMAYSELHNTICSNYGSAGRNFFNVPDMRDTFVKGKLHHTPFDSIFSNDTGEMQRNYTVSSNFDNSVLLPPGPIAPAPGGILNKAEDSPNRDERNGSSSISADFLIAKNTMPRSAPPIGTVLHFGGDYSNPMIRKALSEEGWLPCDGSYLLIEKYSELYNILGSTYGGGNLTFNLPDLRGMYVIGAGHLPVGEKLYMTVGEGQSKSETDRDTNTEESENISMWANSGVDFIIRVR